ncbi:MAG: peptide/nickel transport system ATP-binding protein ddpF [Microbacteriaceae bacterium]|nr:peptide/nickel transport system ATP-binding protein ddpF [Microbacteriaceae bacterium]
MDEVSFSLRAGEVLGLVGESGSGKTTVGMALLGHTRRGGRVGGGSVLVAGRDLAQLGDAELRSLRGATVAYIPQDPGTALNPALRIGTQLREVLETHGPGIRAERLARVAEALGEVALPSDRGFLRRYPHELSGGQQQRVAIAMAFASRPQVIVCDEPTTGLDVTTQAKVLQTVRALCRSHRVAAVYVSHDLAVVAELADRVAVMYAGRIVEQGPRKELFAAPRHPYTRLLLRAVPDLRGLRAVVGIAGRAPLPGDRPAGCSFAPRCPLAGEDCRAAFPPTEEVGPGHHVRCYHHVRALREIDARADRTASPLSGPTVLSVRGLNAHHRDRHTLFDVDLEISRQECLALVGESGSGKTTLGRCISGLHRDYTGQVVLGDELLVPGARGRSRASRQAIQYVFQNPYASLNPRRTVGQAIARQLELFETVGRDEMGRRVHECLEHVALSARVVNRYPDQLSGGERQRVAIARALAAAPALLVCDEITSALDVSVQAAIVDLLRDLRTEMGLGLLFITHNLALIRSIADRVAVMSEGRIVELSATADVFDAPRAAYTRDLLANTPDIEAALGHGRASRA